MVSQQIRKFAMLRRAQQFLDEYAAKLAVVNDTAARKELDQLVAEMGGNEAAQATSDLNARGLTAIQARLRHDLVKHHMRPVARIAAAYLREVPGFMVLRVPPKDVKIAVLIESAIAMAEEARAYEHVFVEKGRPENFVDALLAAATAVRDSIDARGRCIASRAGACAGLKATSSRAHLVLRWIDALVESALVDDPKALAGWKSVRRIGKGRAMPAEATPPTMTKAA